MARVIEKTDFLKGLEEIFKKYGVTKVYIDSPFIGEFEHGMTLYQIGDRNDALDYEVIDYLNHGKDVWEILMLTEHYSFLKEENVCYKDGNFYTVREDYYAD